MESAYRANRRLQESRQMPAEGVILSGVFKKDKTVIGWPAGESHQRVPKVKVRNCFDSLRISQAKGQCHAEEIFMYRKVLFWIAFLSPGIHSSDFFVLGNESLIYKFCLTGERGRTVCKIYLFARRKR